MSRRFASLLSTRPVLAAASPIRAWFGRLAPLAVVVLFGCADKPEALGLGDDEETAADESDESAGESAESAGESAGETADPPGIGGEPDERIASECEQRFTCDCPFDRFADVAACEEHYIVEWAGITAKAGAAGLTTDLECFMGAMPFATYGCDSYSEYAADLEPSACTFCQNAFGARQAGETCQDFGGGVGDCAQGLLCYPSEPGVARCIDPCGQAGAGEACNYQPCEAGLQCDWDTAICQPAGGAGELCLEGVCDDGLACDWETSTCVAGVGEGESCVSAPCLGGLYCGDAQVCVPAASQGESCLLVPCGDGLLCRWDDGTCDVPAQSGDPCLGVDCATGLFCDFNAGTCAPPGAIGDPCVERPCQDGLTCDPQSLTCATPPGLGEPCSDFCADGLACNYDVSPAVCAAWPVGGEPCVVGGCAANFICDYATNLCVDEPALLCGL